MGNKASAPVFPDAEVNKLSGDVITTFGQLYVKAVAYHTAAAVAKENRSAASVAGLDVVGLLGFQGSGGAELVGPGYDDSASAARRDQYLLERPPLASEPLERSWLTKLGEVNKNWKRRFFVACEAADNFAVVYFDSEESAAKFTPGSLRPTPAAPGASASAASNSSSSAPLPSGAKGVIYPCGYLVRSARSEADVKLCGPLGLCLQPLDRRRVWYLRCDSEDVRRRWKLALRHAALHCSAPLSPDPVLAAAFVDAYDRTRRLYGLTGYWRLDRAEQAQLASLCVSACEAEGGPLAPLYHALAAVFERERAREAASAATATAAAEAASAGATAPQAATAATASASAGSSGDAPAAVAGAPWAAHIRGVADAEKVKVTLDASLDKVVESLVEAAWPAMCAKVETQREALHKIAAGNIATILREESARRDLMRSKCMGLLLPLAQAAVAEVSGPILSAFTRPLYKAFKAVLTIMWTRIHEIIDGGLRESELRQLYRDVEWQMGTLAPALAKVRAVTRSNSSNSATGSSSSSSGSSAAATAAAIDAAATPADGASVSAAAESAPAEAATAAAAAAPGTADAMTQKLLSDLRCTYAQLVDALRPVTTWEVEVAAERGLRQLCTSAIYTFVLELEVSCWPQVLARMCIHTFLHPFTRPLPLSLSLFFYLQRSRGGITPAAVLSATARRMLSDARSRIRNTLTAILVARCLQPLLAQAAAQPDIAALLSSSASVAWGGPSAWSVFPSAGAVSSRPTPTPSGTTAAAAAVAAATTSSEADAAAPALATSTEGESGSQEATSGAAADASTTAAPASPKPAAAPSAPATPSTASAAAASSSAATPKTPSAPSSSAAVALQAVRVVANKKTKAAAEAELTSASVSDVFLDADWTFSVVVREALLAAITAAMDDPSGPVPSLLARFDKMPAKLGFS